MIRLPWRKPAFAVAIFFAFKVALGAAILVASAQWMTVASFAIFSQLLILIGYLASIGTAGVQNGLIRQVAAATGDEEMIARELRAGIAIWTVVATVAAIGGIILRTQIAVLLTGGRDVAWVVPWLAVFAMWSGLGQLLCSVLTGMGRAHLALLAQGVGLVGGTVPALLMLHRGDPAVAALLFSGGQGLTTLLAAGGVAPILRSAWQHRETVKAEVRRLLGFSGAFLAVTSIMPLTLIALRSVYRTAFGLDALGYWLAANRVSDVNTQLLGLYMTQAFLPAMASAPSSEHRRLALRTAAIALPVMAIPLVLFLVAPTLLVRAFLSAKFVPALPFFIAYFAGDVLRVGASLASFSALAHARLKLYVGLESTAAILMTFFVIALSAIGKPSAPAIAYVTTYAMISFAAGLFLVRERRTTR